MPQPWGISVYAILVGHTWKFAKYKWSYGARNFSAEVLLHPCADKTIQGSLYYVQVPVIIFSRSRGFVTHRKKLEEVEFVNEEFQYKTVNNKDFYMWTMLCYWRYFRRYMQLLWQSGLSGVRYFGDLVSKIL